MSDLVKHPNTYEGGFDAGYELASKHSADALEALQAERDRLREAGRYLLRAFDHINENPRRDTVDDVFLMVRDTSTISSVSDARAALGETT